MFSITILNRKYLSTWFLSASGAGYLHVCTSVSSTLYWTSDAVILQRPFKVYEFNIFFFSAATEWKVKLTRVVCNNSHAFSHYWSAVFSLLWCGGPNVTCHSPNGFNGDCSGWNSEQVSQAHRTLVNKSQSFILSPPPPSCFSLSLSLSLFLSISLFLSLSFSISPAA